jgi:hypothetical protein
MNVPDERLRAAAREWRMKNRENYIKSFAGTGLATYTIYDEDALLADYAKEREDSALLEAAGLICPFCEDTQIWRPTIHDDIIGAWLHRRLTDAPDDRLADDRMCAAYKIHERRMQKGNG